MTKTGNQRRIVQEDCLTDEGYSVSQDRQRLLSTISRADEIAGIENTSTMVQQMMDLMIEVCKADSANFFRFDHTTDELIITHVRGDTESQYLIGLRLNRKQDLPGISLSDTRVMVVGDLPVEMDWLRSVDPLHAAHKKNVINLPVSNGEHSLGIVQIFNFEHAELDLLLVLSKRLAAELDRRDELDSLYRSNQRLLTLVDMLHEVAGTLDRTRLLHLVTENAARLVNAERSSLFLVDPNTGEMLFQVAYHPPDNPPQAAQQSEEPHYRRRPRISQPVSKGAGSPPRPVDHQDGEFSFFNRSAITVPLHSEPRAQDHLEDRKHVLGGLMVLNNPQASFQNEDVQLMQILANQTSTFLEVTEIYESTGELFLGAIKSMVAAIDAKDPYTQGHSQRVSDYSILIAKELGLHETLVNDIRIGSLLHDIGKIGIPDSILLKNGKLSDEEMSIMRSHPRTGVSIMSQVKLMDTMLPAILEHHERLDGSGYPSRLAGKQITLMGRIVAVADVFDAMTSNRPYRQALSIQEVLSFQREKAGKLFDPDCVEALELIVSRSN